MLVYAQCAQLSTLFQHLNPNTHDIEVSELVYEETDRIVEGRSVGVRNVEYSTEIIDPTNIFMILMFLSYENGHFRNSDGFLDSDSAFNFLNLDGFSEQFYKYMIIHYFSHKHRSWSYEEETRLLSMPVSFNSYAGVRKLNENKVKEIVFGANMPEAQKSVISKIFDGDDVQFKQSRFSQKHLGVEIVPI